MVEEVIETETETEMVEGMEVATGENCLFYKFYMPFTITELLSD